MRTHYAYTYAYTRNPTYLNAYTSNMCIHIQIHAHVAPACKYCMFSSGRAFASRQSLSGAGSQGTGTPQHREIIMMLPRQRDSLERRILGACRRGGREHARKHREQERAAHCRKVGSSQRPSPDARRPRSHRKIRPVCKSGPSLCTPPLLTDVNT